MPPLVDSLALGGGNISVVPSYMLIDQRKSAREFDGTVDIGAVELSGYEVNTTLDLVPAAETGTPIISLRDAALLADQEPSNSVFTILFDPSVFGTAKTITLSQGSLSFDSDTTIDLPAAGLTLAGTLANTGSLTFNTGGALVINSIVNNGSMTLLNTSLMDQITGIGALTVGDGTAAANFTLTGNMVINTQNSLTIGSGSVVNLGEYNNALLLGSDSTTSESVIQQYIENGMNSSTTGGL
jgi:hypothetical protein